MNEVLTTIRLNGDLGKKFGRVHKFAVHSTAEAVKAMCMMIPGFKVELNNSKDRGLAYAVFVGKDNVGKDELSNPANGKTIKIVPVIQGSKSAGLLQVVIGAVLIAASFIPGFQVLAPIGISMVLGGVVSLLSPQQKTNSNANGTSYNFNGATNTIAQGNPVPLLYGRLIVGSAVINAGIFAADQL